MPVMLPGRLVVVLVSVSADVAEVRHQLSVASANVSPSGRDALAAKGAELAAVERAIGVALADQGVPT